MSRNFDSRNGEFATALAAAAFAIYSLEREGLETSRTGVKSRREDTTVTPQDSRRASRRLSIKEAKNIGEASMRKPPETGDQKQKENLKRRGNGETKADAWEKAEMEKIRKRYEKMKSAIFAWENEKKTKAKFRMERKKSELEHRRERNLQHYQMKIAGIDQTAGGARAQVEEKRRIEESKVKDKAKKIRSTGKVHNACLCF